MLKLIVKGEPDPCTYAINSQADQIKRNNISEEESRAIFSLAYRKASKPSPRLLKALLMHKLKLMLS